MKNNKKVIAICTSGAFYKQALEVEQQLIELGYRVEIPSTAHRMKRSGDFKIETYKTWYDDPSHYHKKRALMEEHFEKIVTSDAVLVLNYTKKGIEGYIGGNVLMEMAIAFHYKKPIFILNPIQDDLNIKEEVYGLGSIFVNNDLGEIEKNI